MTIQILEEARLFLVHNLRGKPHIVESRHPWRRGWEFAVLHSLRVESYVTEILAREKAALSEREVIQVRLAAILHDIGRLDQRESHATLGAEIARKWLQEVPGLPFENGEVERVVEMIADHSNKEVHEQDLGKAILKDADTLDEIGVMSIFMAGNWVEMQSPFFFYELRQRLIEIELPFCDKKLALLNTNGAKEILSQKKAFMENFISQITDELQADSSAEQLVFGLSKGLG